MTDPMTDLGSRKICVIGEFSVGKTSLTRRFALRQFSETYRATVGVNIQQCEAQIDEGQLRLVIWDLEGGIDSLEKIRTHLVGAAGALIVGDQSRLETLAALKTYAEYFATERPGAPMLFALNKADLAQGQGGAFAAGLKDYCFVDQAKSLFETSAATGQGVDEAFAALASAIVARQAG